jgi:hypothetical protein
MSDHAAESMKFKVTQLKSEEDTQPNRDFRILTLDKIFAWIDKKDYDEKVKEELKKMISKYPHSAYSKFGKNFQKNLSIAQKAANKNRPLFVGELGDSNYKRLDSLNDDFKTPEPKKMSLPSVKSIKNDFDEMDMPEINKTQISKDQKQEEIVPKKEEIAKDQKQEEILKDQKQEEIVQKKEEIKIPYGLKEISNDEF